MELEKREKKCKKVVPNQYKHFREDYIVLLEENKDLILAASSRMFEDSYMKNILSILSIKLETIYPDMGEFERLQSFSIRRKPTIVSFRSELRQRSIAKLENDYNNVQPEYQSTILHIILTHLQCYILETYCEKIVIKHDNR